MSSEVAISVRGLAKSYDIRHHHEQHITLAEQVLQRVRHPLRRAEVETFWALDDVSFDVHRGEVLGVIGRNGAGKSTLLKVLSRITAPTRGEVRIYGRIGSLLEVGTGFHPELTGRENVYLNGSILGMRTSEIDRQFDAIVDFAGVERFLDTPVKRYSSGMYVRLAFAVAAHLETEILIVDEVLAVGDAEFQRKSAAKMGDAARDGRTVIVVSHNTSLVEELCSRLVLLSSGSVQDDGDPAKVLASYGGLASHTSVSGSTLLAARSDKSAVGPVVFEALEIVAGPVGLGADEDIVILADVVRRDLTVAAVRLSLSLSSSGGVPIGAAFTDHIDFLQGERASRLELRVRNHGLAPGEYSISLGVGRGGMFESQENYDAVLRAVSFVVRPPFDEDGVAAKWESHWGAIRFKDISIRQSAVESSDV